MRGCAISRRYIDVCYCDMFSVVNVYLDHLKFCVLLVEGMSVVVNVMLSLMSVMSPPSSCLVQLIGRHCCEVMYFGCFDFRGELGFRNCDDVCMCVVNKQLELLEFVFESVYVDLQYDEINLTFTAGYVCLCGVCSPVVVICLPVRFLTCICLWQISQIQTSLRVVDGPGLVSTSPAFMRSIASHPAGPHGQLAQKNSNRAPIAGGWRGRHNLHMVCQTVVTALLRVGCVVWSLVICSTYATQKTRYSDCGVSQ